MITSTTKEGFEIGFLQPDKINYGTLKTRHKSGAYLIQRKIPNCWVWVGMVYSMQNKLRPRILQTKSSIVFSDKKSEPTLKSSALLFIELIR